MPRISLFVLLLLLLGKAINSTELLPFVDINDVQRIWLIAGKTIEFESIQGTRILDLKNRQWSLRVYPFKYKNIYEKSEYSGDRDAKLPYWYRPAFAYIDVWTEVVSGGNKFTLVRLAGEGGTYIVEDIIDVSSEKVYRMPYQDTRCITVDSPYIWLGYRRGICRLNMNTGERIDYYVLPKFQNIVGWVDYKNIRYLTTDDGELLAFEINTGVISRITIPKDIIKNIIHNRLTFYWKSEKSAVAAIQLQLTNPIVINNILYVGALPTDFVGRYAKGRSIVLLYDIDKEKWNYIHLTPNFGIAQLALLDKTVWCLGNRCEGYEGGEIAVFGGLAVITDINKLISFDELNGIPIGGFRLYNDTVFIITDKFYLDSDYGDVTRGGPRNEPPEYSTCNFGCKIPIQTMQINEYLPLSENDVVYNQFKPLQFSLSSTKQEKLSSWRVQMKITDIHDRCVHLLTQEDF